MISAAVFGVVSVVKLKFATSPLHIVDGVVRVLVISGVGSTITFTAANGVPGQFEVPCNLGVKMNSTVAALSPLLVNVPLRVAAPATNT